MTRTILLCLLMTFAWGCTYAGPDPARDLVRAGENPNDYLVGGGVMLKYRAPEAGTAVMLDRTGGRIIATESLKEGDLFDVQLDPTDEDVREGFRQASGGIPLEKADIRLYFFPSDKSGEVHSP
ncbi:hypothetical protein ACERK3_13705 [Phycisphaerales bacterium AB-hyl4]|uniref:Uncharacterized protein n=1 Tax=Natronomicrosphaera hydrolytica TaxID=3242702 RepID=A0ABV4U6X6_9BACT